MMRRKRFPAPFAKADIIFQTMKQNFVNFIGGPFPAVIKPLLVYRTVKGLGERKIQVQFLVILLQFWKRPLSAVRESRLFDRLSLLEAAQKVEEQFP